MTVAELQRILADVDPSAQVVVSYHACHAFWEDDVATFTAGMDDTTGRPSLYLLTEGFTEAADSLDIPANPL